MPKEKTKEFKASTYSLAVEVLRKLEEYSKETMIQKMRIMNKLLLST